MGWKPEPRWDKQCQRYRVTILALASTAGTFAETPDGYYNSINATNSTTLRLTLHAVIDDHERFPCTSGSTDTRNILNLADQDAYYSGHILEVYKSAPLT